MSKPLAIFFTISLVVVVAYVTALTRLAKSFPSYLPGHDMWLSLHTLVPSLLLFSLGLLIGVWRRSNGIGVRFLVVVWCLFLPPTITILDIINSCAGLKDCL
jgi:hypothetical protein